MICLNYQCTLHGVGNSELTFDCVHGSWVAQMDARCEREPGFVDPNIDVPKPPEPPEEGGAPPVRSQATPIQKIIYDCTFFSEMACCL